VTFLYPSILIFLTLFIQLFEFRFAILILVIISAVMIGMSTYPRFTGNEYEYAFKIIDQIILSVFIFEIAAKWMYDFRLFWKVNYLTAQTTRHLMT
jgi:hypothetical protein